MIAELRDQASHCLVDTAIESLTHLAHFGAMADKVKTGDGCRLLMKTLHTLVGRLADKAELILRPLCASGGLFLSQDALSAEAGPGDGLVAALRDAGLKFAGCRDVAGDLTGCSDETSKALPDIQQIFVTGFAAMQADVCKRRPESLEGASRLSAISFGLATWQRPIATRITPLWLTLPATCIALG